MTQLQDFWGEPLAQGDWVIYSVGQTPRLGRVVKVHSVQLEIREHGGRRRDTRFQPETDRRHARNVIRVAPDTPALSWRLLRQKEKK